VYFPNEETNLLLIPMRIGRDVVGCQLIDIEGRKKFLRGQRTAGAEFVFGSSGRDIWCEGFCTGLAVHAALQALRLHALVHVTFSAGNLKVMAKSGWIVADNDASGTGEESAKKTGLPYYLPEIEGEDFCDEWQRIGTFKASMRLQKFLCGIK
jgi:putative DNA primase/helicase